MVKNRGGENGMIFPGGENGISPVWELPSAHSPLRITGC